MESKRDTIVTTGDIPQPYQIVKILYVQVTSFDFEIMMSKTDFKSGPVFRAKEFEHKLIFMESGEWEPQIMDRLRTVRKEFEELRSAFESRNTSMERKNMTPTEQQKLDAIIDTLFSIKYGRGQLTEGLFFYGLNILKGKAAKIGANAIVGLHTNVNKVTRTNHETNEDYVETYLQLLGTAVSTEKGGAVAPKEQAASSARINTQTVSKPVKPAPKPAKGKKK